MIEYAVTVMATDAAPKEPIHSLGFFTKIVENLKFRAKALITENVHLL